MLMSPTVSISSCSRAGAPEQRLRECGERWRESGPPARGDRMAWPDNRRRRSPDRGCDRPLRPRAVSSRTGTDDCWRSDFNNSNPVPPGNITSRMISSCSPDERSAQSGGMIVGRIHVKAFAFEEAFEQIDQAVIVVDDEQTIHGIYFALSRAAPAVKNCFEMCCYPSHFLTFLHPLLTAVGAPIRSNSIGCNSTATGAPSCS